MPVHQSPLLLFRNRPPPAGYKALIHIKPPNLPKNNNGPAPVYLGGQRAYVDMEKMYKSDIIIHNMTKNYKTKEGTPMKTAKKLAATAMILAAVVSAGASSASAAAPDVDGTVRQDVAVTGFGDIMGYGNSSNGIIYITYTPGLVGSIYVREDTVHVMPPIPATGHGYLSTIHALPRGTYNLTLVTAGTIPRIAAAGYLIVY
jgi:hypothetical protein